MRKDERTAQLRILPVDSWARGRGIALWTGGVLISARCIYQAAGFVLADEDRHHSFGRDLVGQHWKLSL